MGCNASRSTGVSEGNLLKPGQPPAANKSGYGKRKGRSSPTDKPAPRKSTISVAIFGDEDPRSPHFHSAPTLSTSVDDDHTPMSGLTVSISRRPSIDDSASPKASASSHAEDKQVPLAAKFLRNLTESEQFRIGLKLSAQEQQYGTNMFDSLQQSDLVELERLVATGVTHEDAATYIFERRFQSIIHAVPDRHRHAHDVESNMPILHKPPSLAIEGSDLLELPGLSGGSYFDPIVPTSQPPKRSAVNDEIPQFVPFASFGKRKASSPKSALFGNNTVVPMLPTSTTSTSEVVTSSSLMAFAAPPPQQQQQQQPPRVLHPGHIFYQGKWLSPRQRLALQEQELYLQQLQQRRMQQQHAHVQWQGQGQGQQVWQQNASNRPYLQQMLQGPKAHLISGAHQDITQGSPMYMSSPPSSYETNNNNFPHNYA